MARVSGGSREGGRKVRGRGIGKVRDGVPDIISRWIIQDFVEKTITNHQKLSCHNAKKNSDEFFLNSRTKI